MVTIWDILITWAITRILDHFLKAIGARFDFKEFKQAFHSVWLIVDRGLTEAYCNLYLSDKDTIKIAAKLELLGGMHMLHGLLRDHKRLHRVGLWDATTCRSCRNIVKNKEILLEFVPDPELYPPFSFSKE